MTTKTKFHRDGTVTVWDVHAQQWRRMTPAALLAAGLLPTLPRAERARIERRAAA